MDTRIAELKNKSVYFGTSSWKYEGWKGMIYEREYTSQKKFNDGCLEEYAGRFPAVGVDHTYYAWPLPSTFQRYVDQTPDHFRFGPKITDRVTVFKFPNQRRYGPVAGKLNEAFLDANVFREKFLEPLQPFKHRLAPLMLEFSQFYPGTFSSGREFVDRLDKFFEEVEKDIDGFQLAVEMRNSAWLKKPYFDVLQKHRVSHVFNSWTRMPSLSEQLELAGDFSPPAYVSRVLLKPGRSYTEAVKSFSPYDRIQEEQPEVREGAAQLISKSLELNVPAYVYVNNRCEGCAPLTILGIVDLLDARKPRRVD